MDWAVTVESAASVRAAIARVILGAESHEPQLGSIRLKRHQSSSIARLEGALQEFGGALLCDDVGMGKTFVALAIARGFRRRLIVAPAALRHMWRDALVRTDVAAEIMSFEALSRSDPPSVDVDLLIVDESHHARNTGTQRYRRLSQLTRNARVLLLTATPVHNRRADLVALLSLFLGSRSRDLTERELSRCVVRRERDDAPDIIGIPRVDRVTAVDFPDDSYLVARLMTLPPPLPVSDGGSGGALINRGLVHQWSSSEVALRDALRRRVAKATALTESLRAGRYPTAADLQSWTFADSALQLGFPELLSPPASDAATLLKSVLAHARGLEILLRDHAGASTIDQARANALVRITRKNIGAKIVAFAQYSSTVAEMFRRLASCGRVAMLTASGARVSGGKLSRQDAIARFAPHANRARPPSRAETIDLLLATDLLSEGVNLQDAEVVVHLDVPWTAARMEQRVGRVARMGSLHSRVKVYQFRPPASAEAVLRAEELVSTKWNLARKIVGANPAPFPIEQTEYFRSSIPSRAQQLRAAVERWVAGESECFPADGHIHVAAVTAGEEGFIAAGYLGDEALLLTCRGAGLSMDLNAQIASCLLAEGAETSAPRGVYDEALNAVEGWAKGYEASVSAGAVVAAPGNRKHILNRIDAALQRAPPHLRASRARIATIARGIAAAPHGTATEKDLEALADSPLPDDDWLDVVAAVGKGSIGAKFPPPSGFKLVALLLFRP